MYEITVILNKLNTYVIKFKHGHVSVNTINQYDYIVYIKQ